MPLIKRKMRHRAATGEMLPNLASEAAELAVWIGTKAVSHQVPTERAIENSLRQEYAVLRAEFTPTKP
ncbi:MAG TPA: hypothetical protein VIL69_01040 [Roseomonas sp.]|jgi:hypothetical protein